MGQIRRADASWSGDLLTGGGSVSATSSSVFTDLPITWKARTEEAGGKTSPEELLAGAHASCFAMASSNELAKAGFPPERMAVSVEVGADRREAGWTVLSSHITLRAKVPGVDEATFLAAAERAKGAARSRALSPATSRSRWTRSWSSRAALPLASGRAGCPARADSGPPRPPGTRGQRTAPAARHARTADRPGRPARADSGPPRPPPHG